MDECVLFSESSRQVVVAALSFPEALPGLIQLLIERKRQTRGKNSIPSLSKVGRIFRMPKYIQQEKTP
jgi:hypothetical protein